MAGGTKSYYAQPQCLLNSAETVNEIEVRPNYVQISERRRENERNGLVFSVAQNIQFTSM
nr:WxL domain-containing protein [Enterococcus casseliflavus]